MRSRSAPCRVLVVHQSESLTASMRVLFETGELVGVGSASFREAEARVREVQPHAIVVDLSEPEAFLAIEQIMAEEPTPILALRSRASLIDPFPALALGALELAERPDSPSPEFWRDLARQLILISEVKVVRHVQGKRKRKPTDPVAPGNAPPFPVVAIAASLGGPRALVHLFRMLPKAFPAPICVCQHISDGFTRGLAQWLGAETTLPVIEPVHGTPLEPGRVYIAPSGAHLRVQADVRLALDHGAPLMGFRPSCNALLSSAAEAFGRRSIGVVLTGMGRDGATGLLEIRKRGGRTIAQDESTCVVYGMPHEAVLIGAAEHVLPLDDIAPALLRLVAQC